MTKKKRFPWQAGAFTALAAAMALSLTGPLNALEHEEDHPDAPENPALREEAQRRLRAYRAVALAEYLDLDEGRALAMNAVISRYDEARSGVQTELARHMRFLRDAANEQDPDADEVRATVERVLDLRGELERLRQEEARELLADLDPARQARLLLFFGEFPREIRRMMREGRHGQRERRREMHSPPQPHHPGPPQFGPPNPERPRPSRP